MAEAPWDRFERGVSLTHDERHAADAAFWRTQKASDFYFCVYRPGSDYAEDDGRAVCPIQPIACLSWDQELGRHLDHILGKHGGETFTKSPSGAFLDEIPEKFSEAMECVFEFSGPAARAREVLLELGFIENRDFVEADAEVL